MSRSRKRIFLAFLLPMLTVACEPSNPHVSRGYETLTFRLVGQTDNAAINRVAVNRYAADQSLWGETTEAQALFVPASGKNRLLYFLAEFETRQIHDDPLVIETREVQLLLEVDSTGRVVAGLRSPVVFDEVPHAVSFHYFFGGTASLSNQLDLRSLPWTGFVSDVYLSEPTGVIDLGRVDW